jgi:hypothetical protein
MDHTREDLDECVFDYLASNPDRFIPITRIFRGITGDTGHRCEVLTDRVSDRRFFAAVCHGLDNRYKNIRKTRRNGTLYLAFERGEIDNTFSDTESTWGDCLKYDIIETMLENNMYRKYEDEYFECQYIDDPLIHELIQYATDEAVDRIVRERSINLNCENSRGQTPLDIAIELNKKDTVLLLANLLIESRTDRVPHHDESRLRELKEEVEMTRKTMTRLKRAAEMKVQNSGNEEKQELLRTIQLYGTFTAGCVCTVLATWTYNSLMSMFV